MNSFHTLLNSNTRLIQPNNDKKYSRSINKDENKANIFYIRKWATMWRKTSQCHEWLQRLWSTIWNFTWYIASKFHSPFEYGLHIIRHKINFYKKKSKTTKKSKKLMSDCWPRLTSREWLDPTQKQWTPTLPQNHNQPQHKPTAYNTQMQHFT